MKLAFPMATTRMSAERTNAGKSAVCECATETVASRRSSNCAIGRPTMFDRPTTTACLPAICTPVRSMRCRQPSGVAGTSPGLPEPFLASSPALNECTPSVSLLGEMVLSTVASSIGCSESSGSCTMMPCTPGSLFRVCTASITCQIKIKLQCEEQCSRLRREAEAPYILLGCRVRQMHMAHDQADRLAGLDLVANVDGRVLAISDLDDCEGWSEIDKALLQLRSPRFQLHLQLLSNGGSVQHARHLLMLWLLDEKRMHCASSPGDNGTNTRRKHNTETEQEDQAEAPGLVNYLGCGLGPVPPASS
eukprot:m.715134 g.715134  ORF g.715134 m.715134 type:complete len:306 (-) comp58785_c0_seq3:1568-2485(-)